MEKFGLCMGVILITKFDIPDVDEVLEKTFFKFKKQFQKIWYFVDDAQLYNVHLIQFLVSLAFIDYQLFLRLYSLFLMFNPNNKLKLNFCQIIGDPKLLII